jgi:hypothetical protein
LAKRRQRRRERQPEATTDYTDPDGNVLKLRQSLSRLTIAKIARESPKSTAATADDAWRRRSELLFERLAVSWVIAGLPLDDQKMLLGRYRMADAETQRWVRQTMSRHVERYIPELTGD